MCLDDSIAIAKFLGPKSFSWIQKANQRGDLTAAILRICLKNESLLGRTPTMDGI